VSRRAKSPTSSDGALRALTPPELTSPAEHVLQLVVLHDVHPPVGTPFGLALRHVGDDWQPAIILVLAFAIWFAPSGDPPPKHPYAVSKSPAQFPVKQANWLPMQVVPEGPSKGLLSLYRLSDVVQAETFPSASMDAPTLQDNV